MLKKIGISPSQYTGLIFILIGLAFVAFPTLIGVFAIRIITFSFLLIGMAGITFARLIKSKLTFISSLVIILVGFYTFANPSQILSLLGIACIISGANGLFLNFTSHKQNVERTIISSVLLIALGVFAMVNTKAALETIVTILGLIVVIIGLIIFFVSGRFKFANYSFYSSASKKAQNEKERVVVQIDNDDVEEIDFKEL